MTQREAKINVRLKLYFHIQLSSENEIGKLMVTEVERAFSNHMYIERLRVIRALHNIALSTSYT